jgi:hypothetical protein
MLTIHTWNWKVICLVIQLKAHFLLFFQFKSFHCEKKFSCNRLTFLFHITTKLLIKMILLLLFQFILFQLSMKKRTNSICISFWKYFISLNFVKNQSYNESFTSFYYFHTRERFLGTLLRSTLKTNFTQFLKTFFNYISF